MPEPDAAVSIEETSPGSVRYLNLAEIPFVLGGQTFPVPPKAMRLTQSIKVDEVDIPEKSGKVKQPTGFENVEITVELEICHLEDGTGAVVTTAQDRVRVLQRLYRESGDALPKPHDIVSPLTDLAGVKQVLIQTLEIGLPNDLDFYPVTMTLTEYQSIKAQLDAQARAEAAKKQAQEEGADAIEGNETLNRELGYVRDQFNEGLEAGSGVEAPSEDGVAPPAVPE